MAKILIVDDDPDFVATTRIVLERDGHGVTSAADSQQALECMSKETPDLVILDVIMSTVLDGLSVSREMAERADTRDIPIIMVTSIAGTSYAELFPTDEYIHLDSFLSKPVSPEKLSAEVRRILAKQAP